MGRVQFLAFLCIFTEFFVCYRAQVNRFCSKSDLEALTDFKNGLQDPGNRLRSWRGINCCQWQGIRCNSRTGAVVSIDLKNPSVSPLFSLSGDISPSLVKLRSLQHLDLSLNSFSQIPIPKFLGSLKSLQYLNLSKAGFSGVVPPSLGNLSLLVSLDVSSEFSGLSVDSFDWVSGLVSLKHLVMDGTDLSLVGSNWVEPLNKLPSVTSLHLSACGLSGAIATISPVNFSSLAVIDLSINSFDSVFPDWLVNVSSLTYVDLSLCGLYGRIPLGFSELPNLRFLNLAMNNNLSASCSQLFRGSWKKIEVLRLASNKLHGRIPASVGNMSSLVVFDLFDNSVEGSIPPSIGKLCKLQNFDLSGNNLTGTLPGFLEGNNCQPRGVLPSLVLLILVSNHLTGKLPNWLVQLENLEELSLDSNRFQGSIPAVLGNLRNLTSLGLSGNQLTGEIPDSLGQLSELTIFDVSFNQLKGSISDAHFSKLNKLKILRLSSNSLVFSVNSTWIPPFQAGNLDIGSCNLGPSFPAWLRTQNKLGALSISNASISDKIPDWFWGITSNLSLLNISFNHLQGKVPIPFNIAPFADVDFSSNLLEGPVPLPSNEIELLDFSKNRFSGPIPENLSKGMPNLIFLSLSGNRLTGEIPVSIGEMQLLQVIDLSNNSLIGTIPESIGNCSFLKALDLSFNNLSGSIPSSLGQLTQLHSLHLNNNNLTGNTLRTFQNLSSLETLDIANNGLCGEIPPWIGGGILFPNLRILRLRSNAISGKIPSTLSNLNSLQVLDLAQNNLTGEIPATFGDFKAMSSEQYTNRYLLYGNYRGVYYEESLEVNIKGGPQKYTKTLSLVTSIDVSGNNLVGEFPDAITKLIGLVALNVSHNKINGEIPENISKMRQLASLDLSNNRFSGEIPSSMESMSFLSALVVSNNNFSGRIPSRGQLSTFPASSFAGNPGLCGDPVEVECQVRGNKNGGTVVEDDEDDRFIDKWFYLSIGVGFAAGILVPMLVLSYQKTLADSYFNLVDRIVDGSMNNQRAKRRN